MATTMDNYQQRPTTRPRAKSSFSVTSDKSEGSKKEKLRESHDEKRKLAFSNTGKANPNAAMNELQPIAQQLEKSTIGSLRDGQFFDVNGNPIMDPDLSNPTRRRTERPLETIMSFEAAIDREYRKQREANRQSFAQHDTGATDTNGYESRRSSSYYGGGASDYPNNNGYYNQIQRGRGSYFEPPSRNRFGARQHSDPALSRYNTSQGVYSSPSYGMTRDTINTGISNGSASDQWHNSTDPSSDDSSIERMKPDGRDVNHPHAQSRQPISEEGRYTYGQAGYNPAYMSQPAAPGPYNGQQFSGPPVVPPKADSSMAPPAARQVIRLDQSGSTAPESYGRPSLGEEPKRKSWLKRTFSKKG